MFAPYYLDRSREVRHRDLPFAPVEVARVLRHLPGFFFLDTATADEPGSAMGEAGAISVIGAKPVRVHKGHVSDVSGLTRRIMEGCSGDRSVDLGVPCGGLFGWFDYSGSYVFGEYRDLLVYHHGSGEWWEVGSLADEMRSVEKRGFVPGVSLAQEMGRETFLKMVASAKEYIAAGDIYQVNLAQRFSSPWGGGEDAFSFYERLREVSPAPHAAFFDLDGRQVLSSSPELFLRMSGNTVTTRPIKGTRPRFRDPGQDEKSAYDLITSTKEVAELVMITDLERNDLGQVCEFGSVRVEELLKVERFAQVFHLVSTVCGTLRPGVAHPGALARCFPGGSITGAPKKRASEIIAELEPVPRGIYTGAIGYFGAGGESQFNIAIRTVVVGLDRAEFHVGAGIVADSVPEAEYEETLHKASGILGAAGQRSTLPLAD